MKHFFGPYRQSKYWKYCKPGLCCYTLVIIYASTQLFSRLLNMATVKVFLTYNKFIEQQQQPHSELWPHSHNANLRLFYAMEQWLDLSLPYIDSLTLLNNSNTNATLISRCCFLDRTCACITFIIFIPSNSVSAVHVFWLQAFAYYCTNVILTINPWQTVVL